MYMYQNELLPVSSYYEMAFEVTLRIILIIFLLPLDVEENWLEAYTTEEPEVTSLQDKILENLHHPLSSIYTFCEIPSTSQCKNWH